jgi:hypothetical protein
MPYSGTVPMILCAISLCDPNRENPIFVHGSSRGRSTDGWLANNPREIRRFSNACFIASIPAKNVSSSSISLARDDDCFIL